jgi:hypothetical protein
LNAEIADWPRQHFTKPGGRPFLFYVAFGAPDIPFNISRSQYRCGGVPDGVELMTYGPQMHPDTPASFRAGYLWEELQRTEPDLAALLAAQIRCIVLRAELDDSPTLNYLRDCVGLLTWMLDNGCVGLYDPWMFRYWSRQHWHKEVFESATAVPRHHVTILQSSDGPDTTWYHTRGMRKFGRPDLSVPNTPVAHREAVIDLINRFIEFQAFGATIEEGREIRIDSLPQGLRCFHRGDLDDPEFNNVHVAIERTPG